MTRTSAKLEGAAAAMLTQLGEQIRSRRLSLGLTSVDVAEAAGTSRVTLHRIENGHPSVAIGFYVTTLAALGLELDLVRPSANKQSTESHLEDGWIPIAIRVEDYPELARLAWHVKAGAYLRPLEALGIYERNKKHLDVDALGDKERALIEGLRAAWGGPGGDV